MTIMENIENPLAQLYDDVILQHNRAPCHYEKRQTAQHIVEAFNPLCGDKFKLFLDIEDGRVQKASFHGYGCAISKAATSVLMGKIQNMPVVDVLQLIKMYFEGLNGGNTGNTEGGDPDKLNPEFKAFAAVRQFPERLTCATLSWEAAQTFFKIQS
jgi:nitrogen fixation protein NifU and related proteins